MAQEQVKISALTAGTPLDTDIIPYVDLVTNTTKKALKSELKGEQGNAATVDAGTTTTLAAGESATVTNVGTVNDAIFSFAIPQGIQGLTGDTGAKVVSVVFVGNDMVFTLDDASTVTLTSAKTDLKGDTGLTGAKIVSASFVGDDLVFVLDDASTVTVTGAKTNLKGDTGLTGETGNGITSITKTGTVGLVDTYTITYTDATTATFDVTNGEDGANGTNGTNGTDGISFIWKGAYVAETAYQVNDVVSYNGSTYICILASTGNLPTNATYWSLMAQKGTDGTGSGDISGSGVANELAYFTAEKTIDNLPVATYPSLAEVSYVKGVTSAIQTQFTGKVDKSTYDAHSVLYATTDNTPVALTVGEQTVVGRATGGNISALAIDSDLSSVSANDDTIPSAKATKAALDLKAPLANPTFTGTVTLPTTQLGETSIKLDSVLSADEKWSGITTSGTLGATIAVGDLCYLNADDGRWELVDANLSDGYDKQLGICLLAGNDGSATEMLVFGKVRSAAFPAFTVGSPLYVSETAGDITHTQPTTADVAIRLVGFALTAEDLLFNPSNDYIIKV